MVCGRHVDSPVATGKDTAVQGSENCPQPGNVEAAAGTEGRTIGHHIPNAPAKRRELIRRHAGDFGPNHEPKRSQAMDASFESGLDPGSLGGGEFHKDLVANRRSLGHNLDNLTLDFVEEMRMGLERA